MKIIRHNEVKKVQNSKQCWVSEYPLEDKDINGAFVELTGREPDEGRVVNLVCKELAYVINGSGKLVANDEEINLRAGDLVVIEPGEKFFWDGNMTLFLPCTPAWYPEQYKKVE
ncbi:MAG: cupin domain-containing protein [Candidatus Paceibacterota bacterium]